MSHIHTLRRVSKKKDLFMCADSICTWTRRKEFLIGKKFLCPLCGKEYLVNSEMLRRKLPHCLDCTVTNVFKSWKVNIPQKEEEK